MKQFIVDRHTTPNTPTLEQVPTEKIPVYEDMDAAAADLANLAENQIIATHDTGSELSAPVDTVQSGNMHAVSSNAVAEALHISDFSSISGGYVYSFTCTETGFYYLTVHTYFSNGSFDGIKINNGSIGGCASSTGTGDYYSTMTMLLKKGDVVTIANGIGNSAFNVRGYSKLSDFFN